MNMLIFASEMAKALEVHAARIGVEIEELTVRKGVRPGEVIVTIGQSIHHQRYSLSNIVSGRDQMEMEHYDWILGRKGEMIVRAFAKGMEDARTAAERESNERSEIGRRVVHPDTLIRK